VLQIPDEWNIQIDINLCLTVKSDFYATLFGLTGQRFIIACLMFLSSEPARCRGLQSVRSERMLFMPQAVSAVIFVSQLLLLLRSRAAVIDRKSTAIYTSAPFRPE
jgi:hypothetical protein